MWWHSHQRSTWQKDLHSLFSPSTSSTEIRRLHYEFSLESVKLVRAVKPPALRLWAPSEGDGICLKQSGLVDEDLQIQREGLLSIVYNSMVDTITIPLWHFLPTTERWGSWNLHPPHFFYDIANFKLTTDTVLQFYVHIQGKEQLLLFAVDRFEFNLAKNANFISLIPSPASM